MITRFQTCALEVAQFLPAKGQKMCDDESTSLAQFTPPPLVIEEGDKEDENYHPSDWCWNWLPFDAKNRIYYWKTVAEQRARMKDECQEINKLPICPWAGFAVLTEKTAGSKVRRGKDKKNVVRVIPLPVLFVCITITKRYSALSTTTCAIRKC